MNERHAMPAAPWCCRACAGMRSQSVCGLTGWAGGDGLGWDGMGGRGGDGMGGRGHVNDGRRSTRGGSAARMYGRSVSGGVRSSDGEIISSTAQSTTHSLTTPSRPETPAQGGPVGATLSHSAAQAAQRAPRKGRTGERQGGAGPALTVLPRRTVAGGEITLAFSRMSCSISRLPCSICSACLCIDGLSVSPRPVYPSVNRPTCP